MFWSAEGVKKAWTPLKTIAVGSTVENTLEQLVSIRIGRECATDSYSLTINPLQDVFRQIQGAPVLENLVVDQGIPVLEKSGRVRCDDLIVSVWATK